MPIFGLAPSGHAPKRSAWPTSFNATTASTSSPTTASTRSPARNVAAGIPPVAAAPTPRRSSPAAIDRDRGPPITRDVDDSPLSEFLVDTWMPRAWPRAPATTAYRYGWMIDHYIAPAIGDIRLRSLRAEHLDGLYIDLLAHGGRRRRPARAKTVLRSPRRDPQRRSTRRRLPARRHQRRRRGPTTTTHDEATAEPRRSGPPTARRLPRRTRRTCDCYPAFHLAATPGCAAARSPGSAGATGTARPHRLSDRPQPPSHRWAHRRSSHQDPHQPALHRPRPQHRTHPRAWRQRNSPTGSPSAADDPMFTNTTGRAAPPRVDQPTLRPQRRHDSACPGSGSTTCATPTRQLLVAAGVPIKVVSERLGHAHPGFTMAHLPTPAARHGRRRRQPVRRRSSTGRRQPVRASTEHRSTTTRRSRAAPSVDRTGRRPGRRHPARERRKARKRNVSGPSSWWRGQDLNLRPSGYENNGLRPCPYSFGGVGLLIRAIHHLEPRSYIAICGRGCELR